MSNHHLYQVLGKSLQVGIVSDGVLVLLSLLGIDSGLEISFFGVVWMHSVVVGHWEPVLHDVFHIDFGRIE